MFRKHCFRGKLSIIIISYLRHLMAIDKQKLYQYFVPAVLYIASLEATYWQKNIYKKK